MMISDDPWRRKNIYYLKQGGKIERLDGTAVSVFNYWLFFFVVVFLLYKTKYIFTYIQPMEMLDFQHITSNKN